MSMQTGSRKPTVGIRMREARAYVASHKGVSEFVVDRMFGRGTTDRLINIGHVLFKLGDHGRELHFQSDDRIPRDQPKPNDLPSEQLKRRIREERMITSVPCSKCHSDPWESCVSRARGTECGPHYERLSEFIDNVLRRYPSLDYDFHEIPS